MLNRRELQAFGLAPATAPAIAALAFGDPAQILWIAVVAYVAALGLGVPLYVALRRRAWPGAASCLVAGGLAGALAGGLLPTTLLLAVSSHRFVDDLGDLAFFGVAGLIVGAGLGLAAGAALYGLLRYWSAPRAATADAGAPPG